MISSVATLIQGFGTAFIGKRDFWPDGSYLTTEWIVGCFIPLVPRRSLRVKPTLRRTTFRYVAGSISQDYSISDERPPDPKQVACVYGFVASYFAWIFGLVSLFSRLAGRFNDTAGVVTMLVLLVLPWAVPPILRERARHWRPGFK